MRPRGLRNFPEIGLLLTGFSFLLNEKRARIYTPSPKKAAIKGLTASAEIELKPSPPGTPQRAGYDLPEDLTPIYDFSKTSDKTLTPRYGNV
jgi:hypothetical protein